MRQPLHLVFDGELVDPQTTELREPSEIDLFGIYSNYRTVYDACKAKAQATADNAHIRCFVAHPHRLVNEARDASPAKRLS